VRNWRAIVLVVLFTAPTLIYVGLGAVWLAEHRGPLGFRGELLLYGVLLWVLCGVAFAIYANRWTSQERPLLPPIDWERPATFGPRDVEAWEIVQSESEQSETLPIESLMRFETYEESGRSLARRLASHYEPDAKDPVEHVSVVELLTALQLATEDLARLCREVPGGEFVTPAHYRKAVQAAGYMQRATDLYNYLLPVFQPMTGLARLSVQKLVVQPAWRGMQRNLLRWFYQAYVNRLGHHLIELYSGRLVVGAETYRRLTRSHDHGESLVDLTSRPMTIGIAGARGAGRATLQGALHRTREGEAAEVSARLAGAGFDRVLIDRFRSSHLIELPGYAMDVAGLTPENLAPVVEAASGCDLMVLAIDAGRTDALDAEARFLDAWGETFGGTGLSERPPIVAVLTHSDRPELGVGWFPPYDWASGRRPREVAVRERMEATRKNLGGRVREVLAVGLPPGTPFGVTEEVLPGLAVGLRQADRFALLRHLHEQSRRSRARRLAGQIGRQGKKLWNQVRPGKGRGSRAK
jgi:predicted GTPase